MATYAFDTLEQAAKLQQTGFSENEARTLVEVIVISTNNLVTKDDMERCKLEMRFEMQQECSILRQDLQKESSSIRQEMQKESSSIRQEMLLGFSKLENKILRMTISLGLVLVTSLGGYTYLLQWLD